VGAFSLTAMITIGTAFSLLVLPRARVPDRPGRGWVRHPGTWLAVVTLLIYLNQVLFTVYVRRVWHGDVSRIARFLPDGWFALADLGWLADRFPAPELLSWTVLRAQALLELPFVLLAYLVVCRWFGAGVYRRAVYARWAVSASYTVTFCLIEWSLHNPYTVGDIVLRVVSGLVTPVLVARLAEGAAGPPRPVPFVASLAALGCLVLVVYDSALLYNLGHVAGWLPAAGASVVVLAVARHRARREVVPGPAMTAVLSSLGWFLVLFLVPALPLRYGLNFGTPVVSLLAGAVIVVSALRLGWPRELLGLLLLAEVCGAAGAALGYLVAQGFPETRLLAAAAGFLCAGGAACAAADRWSARPAAAVRAECGQNGDSADS
jgi:hypothetical protein